MLTPHSRKEEMLREQFLLHFNDTYTRINTLGIKDIIVEWWLSKMKQDREEMVGKLKAMKRDTDCDEDHICNTCRSFDDCECDGYNEAIDDILSIIKE